MKVTHLNSFARLLVSCALFELIQGDSKEFYFHCFYSYINTNVELVLPVLSSDKTHILSLAMMLNGYQGNPGIK